MINQDKACLHLNFKANVIVNRLTADQDPDKIIAYMAELSINCEDCDEKFRFNGVQAGLSSSRPTCTIDETKLNIPIRPASADPDFGLGLPGFAIRVVEK